MNAAPAASIVPDVSDQPSGAPGENVLSVNGLDVVARTDAGDTPLVEGLTFDLRRGETLCIAGESGSGKSITSLAIMGLLPQPAGAISGAPSVRRPGPARRSTKPRCGAFAATASP